MFANLVAFPLGFWWRAPRAPWPYETEGAYKAPLRTSRHVGERAARANYGKTHVTWCCRGAPRRDGYKTCSDWTEPGGRNAPQPLLLRSQELSPAPRAISRHVRSDKGAQSTPSPKAAAAPLDAMAQHWLLATLVATALALVPPATTAPGLTKLSAYVPSGPSRRPNQISRRLCLRP